MPMANVTFRPSSIASFPAHFLTEWKELINKKLAILGHLTWSCMCFEFPITWREKWTRICAANGQKIKQTF